MMDKYMIAPCGVNCGACGAHLDARKPCPGCRAPADRHKRKSCVSCAKKQCAFGRGIEWCFECGGFPCSAIKSMSRRYARNYGIDLVQNGRDAREDMTAFLAAQEERFTCAVCGGVVNQHSGECSVCAKRAGGGDE